ncbi:paired amphipathic helix protein Sin3a [Pseudohyphozyma bogoriensis]|nr:paired amphipathic helix protein Sin3a [Pseudohyphozyma bogoriensis]
MQPINQPGHPPANRPLAPPGRTDSPKTASVSPAPGTQPASSAAAAPAQPAPTAFRPLNVRDALSYLDKVKQQFSSEYEVYDNFLTIMKDFKTQNIDTPGVIDRVSTLFRGHPSLIQGFNTFLPPGYRIECVVSAPSEDGASNTITVTTPMGVTTRTQDVTKVEAREFAKNQPGTPATSRPGAGANPTPPAATPAAATPAPRVEPPKPRPFPPLPVPATSTPSATTPAPAVSAPWRSQQPATQQPAGLPFERKPSPYGSLGHAPQPARPPMNVPQRPSHALPNPNALDYSKSSLPSAAVPKEPLPAPKPEPVEPTSSAADTPTPAEPPKAKQPEVSTSTPVAATPNAGTPGAATPTPMMEFNHAINYVNKIKNRYIKDPETYKTFLEILQTYQKETRPIQEVYAQVTTLFHGAPDLLDEFKAFLPDTTDQSAAPAPGFGAQQKKRGDKVTGTVKKPPPPAPVVEEKKKRAAPGMGERAKAKRAKTHHALAAESPPIPPAAGPVASTSAKADRDRSANLSNQSEAAPAAAYHVHPYGAPPPGFPGAPRVQSAYDMYLSTHRAPTLVQAEEFGFFDRVKKHLDDRATYTEFLKLLNLFTQEIIDVATLLEKSLLFIGGSDELVSQFKDLVGWDPVKDGRIEGEDWIIDNEPAVDRPVVLLHLMKSFGPSYRKLPDSEIDLACSGRDDLGWSVLNDDWVAYATWASEGSGAHRKNPFEDALYNSEQERHWYSFQIESMSRTIAHLEPLAARIAQMSAEERNLFKLDDGLGGPSPSVYERIIKKIYGKDHGYEILGLLCDNPAVAVPIVLSRLKQKDEEWKRAEREWNKVWREVDNKNFYRALDHQGVTFKQTDKKATTTSKSLTTEIETLKRDKQQKRLDLPVDAEKSTRPLHQFELGMVDRDVLFDVLKLTISFLDRDQSGFSAPERARVEAFLRLFVPLLFGVPLADMEANLGQSDEINDHDEDDVDSEAEGGTMSESDSPASVNGDTLGKKSVNRRGGAADLRKRLLSHAAATAARGQPRSRAASPVDGEEDSATPVGVLGEQTWIHLTEAMEGDRKVDTPLPTRRYNFFANSTFYCLVRTIHTLYHRLLAFKKLTLKLVEEKYQRLSTIGVELGLSGQVPGVDTGENPAEHYYEHMLDLAEKLFDGDIDQQNYEEQLRYMGGIHVYPLFTVDKLVSTVIKHIHTVNGDHKCQDLVTLLEKDRAREYTTPRQQIAYRMEAEATLSNDESLYRIEWIAQDKILTIQLLGKEDLTLDDSYGSEEKMHSSWVASFALTSSTEGVGAQVKAPLLKRNRMLAAAEDPQEFDLTPGLEAKVSDDSYQLLFVANTEDFLHRRRPAGEASTTEEIPVEERRKKRFGEWLANATGSGSTTEVASEDVSMEL